MTAPVYEPNEQRQIAALGYGQGQLFRRPASIGETIEWGAAIFTTDQTVNSGSGSFLIATWDQIYVPDGQIVIEVNPGTSLPNDQRPFQLNRSGIYGIAASTSFTDSNWTDFRWLRVEHSQGSLPDTIGDQLKGGGSGQGGWLYDSWNPVWISLLGASFTLPYLDITQTSGTNKTVTGGHFIVAYYGPAPSIGDMTPFIPSS